MASTKFTSRKQALERLEEINQTGNAAVEAAADELKAATEAFNEWDAPRVRLAAAQQAFARVTYAHSIQSTRAEANIINSSDPLLARTIKELWRMFQENSAKFEVWGEITGRNEAQRVSNADVINTRAEKIRAAITSLEHLQRSGEGDVRVKIRTIMASIPTISELEFDLHNQEV